MCLVACLWFCDVGNVVQAHLAVLTVTMIVILTNVLKKLEEETRNGSGLKWNDCGLRTLSLYTA